ncbi:MAG: AraC family transcriptional regulator N-terminal domain-containing protein [Phyllobacterium sp.]
MSSIDDLAVLIARHAPQDGTHATIVPPMTLIRYSKAMEPVHALYKPALCIVAQGRKQAMLGDCAYVYDPASYLVVAVDLHVIGTVLGASSDRPYLCLQFDLDLVALGDLMLSHPAHHTAPASGSMPGLALSEAEPGLIDAATRLVRLLDEPAGVAALAPLIEREILYRLMTGGQGRMLHHIASSESRLAQIGRAIGWIKRHYASSFGIDDLAGIANMSPSSFHEHFKLVTSMTPLQYRNQLRLQEARRLMVIEAHDAATAGFRVGYDSPSQFSRDYLRVFGASPARDATRLRAMPGHLAVA